MNQAVRNKAFDALETMQLKNRVRELEFDNAELVKKMRSCQRDVRNLHQDNHLGQKAIDQ